ncbi:MAG: Holliday junction branch migration protein RuvA [Clostridia bacterium]|jgi:Holliday junction DNA helicase RuvA|nr:Holliday junction branch migration protein RuvA [Clostridia bacterium]
MYAYIRGTVAETSADRAVVEACGVGYELYCSTMTLKTLVIGEQAKLYTHLHLAEGVQALYGFADTEERDTFRRLLGVTRVGPKLALSVLSVMTPSDVRAAIVTDNPAAFDRVSGMGRKTAQRVILELQESIRQETPGALPAKKDDAKPSLPSLQSEAVAALTSLGYDGLTASRAVAKIKEADTVEELITKALKSMAKG